MSEDAPPPDPRRAAGREPCVDLGDGVTMPLLGAGTQFGFAEDGNPRGRIGDAADHVAQALATGFRLLDTARGYGTEEAVLQGIGRSGLRREDLFVVSKAGPGIDHEVGPVASRAAVAESARRLGGWVDLFLVHHPVPGWQDLWRALEAARDEGLVRAVGVSNFGVGHLEELLGFARHRPVVDQIHLHPFVYGPAEELLRYCAAGQITVMAYPRCPWRMGAGTAVESIAKECGRSPAQVMLRWAIEHGFAVIPLSTDPAHLAENSAVRGFRLTREQVEAIDRITGSGGLRYHVDHVGTDGVHGWAFGGDAPLRIVVHVDGEPVGVAAHGNPRPDVRDAWPDRMGAGESGFAFRFPGGGPPAGSRVHLSIESADGNTAVTGAVVLGDPGPGG